jgi:hypothetical protein
MRKASVVSVMILAALAVAEAQPVGTGARPVHVTRISVSDGQIGQLFEHAMKQSPSFRDLIATVDLLDRSVYIESGRCGHRGQSGCFQLVPTDGATHLVVRVDVSQPAQSVVPRLAHVLYHALEAGREPEVVDEASLAALYRRIGEHSCLADSPSDCWETRAAAAFEQLVRDEMAGVRQ